MAIVEPPPEATDPDAGPVVLETGLDVVVEPAGDALTVRLAGDLDAGAAPALRTHIDRWPVRTETTVDLTGLTFIDSTGIGCLLRLQQRVADAGGLLQVRGPAPAIRRTLEVTGLHRVVAILD